MKYVLTKSPVKSHIGLYFNSIESGQVLTFQDGSVFVIEDIFKSSDGTTLIATTKETQLTFILE